MVPAGAAGAAEGGGNASGGVLYRWNGIILIALFVLYLAYTIYLAKKNKETENDED